MEEKVHVPPIKIQGIKTKLVPFIRANVQISESTLWIEPFLGSGVVGLNYPRLKSRDSRVVRDLNTFSLQMRH